MPITEDCWYRRIITGRDIGPAVYGLENFGDRVCCIPLRESRPDIIRNLKTLFAKFLAGTPTITVTRAWINDAVFTPLLANVEALFFLLVIILAGYDQTAGFRLLSRFCFGGIFREALPLIIPLIL